MAVHTQILRIHYQDTDVTGTVFHGAYLNFAERGRYEALRAVYASPKALADEHGVAFLVRRAELDYLRPLHLDDEVEMRTGTIRVGGASCRLRQDFLCRGILTTRVGIELACVRIDDGRPARIPAGWRRALDDLMEPAEPDFRGES